MFLFVCFFESLSTAELIIEVKIIQGKKIANEEMKRKSQTTKKRQHPKETTRKINEKCQIILRLRKNRYGDLFSLIAYLNGRQSKNVK